MSTAEHAGLDPFSGDGEVREIARTVDWSATSLGPVEGWSRTLRDTVRTCLESPFPINLWCGPGLVLVYNDAYRKVLGAKHPAALGRPGREVWAEIWEEIAPMFERIRAGGPPVYADDAPFVIERAGQPLPAPDAPREPNAWFTFSLSAVRDDSGEIVAFLNVVSESTGRVLAERAREAARERAERAEARLREVFAQAPAFLAVLRGSDHVFEYVNTAYYQLVGHRELVGRPAFEALPELRGQGFETLLDRVLETGEPFIGREVPVLVSRTPESAPEQRFVDLVYYPINEADGTRSGVVAHGSDVTDHVLARREAQRARAEAEQANQAKSQFLANMSHEIRTPINAIMGYTDLLDAGVAGALGERQLGYVERIRVSSQHLLGLVNDVLDLAKIEAGGVMVRMEEAGAREAVSAAIQMVAPQAQARGIVLREAWECGGEATFVGDADRVRQVILNLLSNALKFTAPGGTVTVRCRAEEAAAPDAVLPGGGPWLVVDVEDTGSGIPPEQISRIFEPFVQAESEVGRRAGGTGLGLTISRRFARLMRGELTVRSEVGEGSCFSLWLEVPASGRGIPPVEGWERAAAWPPAGQEHPGIRAVGEALLHSADRIEQELVERLAEDPGIPDPGGLRPGQLADHTAAYLVLLARTLTAIDEAGGEPASLADSEALQAHVAARHGLQRRRLGWSRVEVEREYQILHAVLDDFVRREAPRRTGAELGEALGVLHRLLDQSEQSTLSVYDTPDRGSAPD